jgi:hypothetical protein
MEIAVLFPKLKKRARRVLEELNCATVEDVLRLNYIDIASHPSCGDGTVQQIIWAAVEQVRPMLLDAARAQTAIAKLEKIEQTFKEL